MKRKHRFSSLLLLSVFYFSIPAYSSTFFQETRLTGTVRDKGGETLPGVTVKLKGTSTGTITDEKGNYSIRLPDANGILVFTFIGFDKKEVPISSRNVVNVTMERSSNTSLNEAVVIGYGTQLKRDLTSSVATMKGSEIEKYNVNSFQSAMQGQMAGVEMYESSGVPGAAVNVRIRGLNTINGSAGPLYVVDGIPITSGGGGDGDAPITNDGNLGGTQTNMLTDINPNDIESIEVLKDAASAAIYGARGSGGVILITTKRAKNGKTNFNFSMNTGITEITKEKALLNGPQLLMILDEAHRNSFYSDPANEGLPLTPTPMPAMLNFDRGMADTTNINHLRTILRTGIFQDVSLSASSGTSRTKFYFSGTYKKTIANIRGSEMNQYNFRVNIDHTWNKHIRFGGTIAPSLNKEYRLGSGTVTTAGGYGAAISTNLPIYPLHNADGTYFNPWANPLAFRDRNLYDNNSRRTRLLGSVYFEADLARGLKFRTNAQREDWNQIGLTFIEGLLRYRTTNSGSISPFPDDQLARGMHQNSFGWMNSIESFFTYDRAFGQHKINAVTGMRFSKNDALYEAMYGENFANSNFMYPSQAAFIDQGFQTGAVGEPAANLGYFLRVNYKYREKYNLSFIVNRDGSSRFGRNHRFGTFPAVSGGWIISDEDFMKGSRTINFLKVRASVGLTGNAQGINNVIAIPSWSTSLNSSGYMGTPTSNPARPANADLRWEKGVKLDAGLDMAFAGSRINATLDVYHYTTRDMLLAIPTGTTFGYGLPSTSPVYLENRGSLINKGIEFTINTINITGEFTWKTNFNITRNITEVVSLGGLTPELVSGGKGDVQLYEGREGPVYNLIEWVGVDPETGGELIRDQNNKVVLASSLNAQELAAARKPQFNTLPAPKYYGGIGNTFSYKGIDLSIFFSFRVGNYLLDAGERVASYVGNISYDNSGSKIYIGNLPTTILDRWTHPGQVTDVPKVHYNDPKNDVLRTYNTTRFLSDASFIRLKNLQLAYTLPQKFISSIRLRSARLFFTGQNLFMLTKFKGVDPEAITVSGDYKERNIAYGIVGNVVPQSRMMTFGLNIGF
jgi:TonB-linked SusC/RagA family outer membrane protein